MPKEPSDAKTIRKYLLLVGILAIYTGYLIYKFGSQCLLLGGLTWSAFVLATPIADAGFLLDFPIRLVLGWRMVVSEVFVWSVAIALNLIVYFRDPSVYERTPITRAFGQILSKPWPNWIIIVISCAGTFGSLVVADKIYDLAGKGQLAKVWKRAGVQTVASVALLVGLFFCYRYFLGLFGVEL
ncbi:MAG: hypothetical protein BGO01_08450 [Armatimonadetes bacterium 55-13]|nr:hypothetical protein [Armatimonadota bacterium]OJU62497.1 MAG: hypothetical protein BGO01_08450 [Armatimonadetes bacterium 55-13]